MMASPSVNITAAVGRRTSMGRLNIQRIISYTFSSRVSTSHYPHQGVNVKTADDDVSRIRKSLDNDDGKDYVEEDDRGDVTGFVAEKAIKGTRKTMETAFDAGVSVAEGMEQTLGAVKETTEKVKEAVLGDDHERAPKGYIHDKAADDRLRKNDSGDTEWKA